MLFLKGNFYYCTLNDTLLASYQLEEGEGLQYGELHLSAHGFVQAKFTIRTIIREPHKRIFASHRRQRQA